MKKMLSLILAVLTAFLGLISLGASVAEDVEWVHVEGLVFLPLKQDGAIVGTEYYLGKGKDSALVRKTKLVKGSLLKGCSVGFSGLIYSQKSMIFDFETMEGQSPSLAIGDIRKDFIEEGESPLEALQRSISLTADAVGKETKTSRIFTTAVIAKSILGFKGSFDQNPAKVWKFSTEEFGFSFEGAKKVTPKKPRPTNPPPADDPTNPPPADDPTNPPPADDPTNPPPAATNTPRPNPDEDPIILPPRSDSGTTPPTATTPASPSSDPAPSTPAPVNEPDPDEDNIVLPPRNN